MNDLNATQFLKAHLFKVKGSWVLTVTVGPSLSTVMWERTFTDKKSAKAAAAAAGAKPHNY